MTPRTAIWRELMRLRARAIKRGMRLLSRDEILDPDGPPVPKPLSVRKIKVRLKYMGWCQPAPYEEEP